MAHHGDKLTGMENLSGQNPGPRERARSSERHFSAEEREGQPQCLSELLHEAKSLSDAGFPQSHILTWISRICRANNLRLCYGLVEGGSGAQEALSPGPDPEEPAEVEAGEPAGPEKSTEPEVETGESAEAEPEEPTEPEAEPEEPPEAETGEPAKAEAESEAGESAEAENEAETGEPAKAENKAEAGAQLWGRTPAEVSDLERFRALEGQVGRIIISCDRERVKAERTLRVECNGVIIDALEWRALAVPPRAFNPRPSVRRVNQHLADGHYRLIRVNDGTVVTLYRWNHPAVGPVWCLGTGNGYDVSAFRWMGDLCYAEIVHSLLSHTFSPLRPEQGKAEGGEAPPPLSAAEALGCRLVRGLLGPDDVRLAFDGLDPAFSYTLGFRHPSFHPLVNDPFGIWNIQAVRLADGARCYPRPGLAPRTAPPSSDAGPAPCVRKNEQQAERGARPAHFIAPFQCVSTTSPAVSGGLWPLPSQVYLEPENVLMHLPPRDRERAIRERGGKLTLQACRKAGERSLEVALQAIAAGLCGFVHFNYGVILRSVRPDATLESSDVLVRSKLLECLRRIVYARPPAAERQYITHANRLEYNLLRAHLMSCEWKLIQSLFPHAKGYTARCRELMELVARRIVDLQRERLLRSSANAAGKKTEGGDRRQQDNAGPITRLAGIILPHIVAADAKKIFNPMSRNALSIVLDHLRNPAFTIAFVSILRRPRRP